MVSNLIFFKEGKQANKEGKDELPEEMLVNCNRPMIEISNLQNTQTRPHMNEVGTSVVIIFSLLCLVLALAPAVLAFTFSESRPERDLRIRGSQEVKLSVSSERCKPPTVHRWQATDNSEGHDPLVTFVDANGENFEIVRFIITCLLTYLLTYSIEQSPS